MLSIAERENKESIRGVRDLLFGMVDVFSFILIVLPIFPRTVEGYVYSANLIDYTETSRLNLSVYWSLFLLLILAGIVKIFFAQFKVITMQKSITGISLVLSMMTVIYLVLAGETYAVTISFALLIFKGMLIFKYYKAD